MKEPDEPCNGHALLRGSNLNSNFNLTRLCPPRQQRACWILLGYGLAKVNLRRWAGDFLREAAAAEHKVRPTELESDSALLTPCASGVLHTGFLVFVVGKLAVLQSHGRQLWYYPIAVLTVFLLKVR